MYLRIIGNILGFYWDSGKENGNYYTGLYRDYRVYVGGEMSFNPTEALVPTLTEL